MSISGLRAAPPVMYVRTPGTGARLDGSVTLAVPEDGTSTPAASGDVTAPVTGATPAPAAPSDSEPFPPEFTDEQGHRFVRRFDPATGHLQYAHDSKQADAQGNRLSLAIVLDMALDGSFSRMTRQRLDTVDGSFQEEQVSGRFDPKGAQIAEVTDSRTRTADKELVEHTETTYAAGVPVRRTAVLDQTERNVEPKTQDSSETKIHIAATWDAGGKPLTDATVPSIDRDESATYRNSTGGINKDTGRVLTTKAHASGPLGALRYDDKMQLVVRFDGRKGQYIERELSVPLGADGTPQMDHATEVRTEDHQAGYVKALTQARIWGGFASVILANAGILTRGSLGAASRAMIWAGVAAGAAEVGGELHAVHDKRNDGSYARLAMGVYDLAWLTGYTLLTRRPPQGAGAGSGSPSTVGSLVRSPAAGVGLAGVGLVANGNELLNGQPLLTGFRSGVNAGDLGRELLAPARADAAGAVLPMGASWRPQPRFDAAAALASVL